MLHAVQHLRSADNPGVPLITIAPGLITDHRHGMRIAAHVFARLEAAPQEWMHLQRLKIIGGYDAPCRALGAITDAERRAENAVGDECIYRCAALFEIPPVRP